MPPDVHAQLHQLIREQGLKNASALAYGWVLEAYYAVVDAAKAGVDPGLPAHEPLPQKPEVYWHQGALQWEQCRRAITAAGSSVEAVVLDAARRWVAGGGSLESQRRPKQRTRRLAPEKLAQLRAAL